jgi:hypothetical protein
MDYGFKQFLVWIVANTSEFLVHGVVREWKYGLELAPGKIAKVIGVLGNELGKLEPLGVPCGKLCGGWWWRSNFRHKFLLMTAGLSAAHCPSAFLPGFCLRLLAQRVRLLVSRFSKAFHA